ncbi:serine/threonine-protein kinase [Sphaerisporangium sp. NPDC049002]|uniref:serine/threonine-protein kinase n=1 Tax=Sphaerisporangium sp. NPDC049002 TaxID=3155392 RepID=UPI0033FA9FEF
MLHGVILRGRYKLFAELGKGSMGEVWKAFDRVLGRGVAVKVLRDNFETEPKRVQRFVNEAKIGAQLQHPGIVAVFDFGEHEGRHFCVMELLDGEDLAKVMTRAPNGLPIESVVNIIDSVAAALEAAHSKGVIHRDIKPANVMILDGGATKICDFGVARMVQPFAGKGTAGIGTLAYMAPEQFQGGLGERADLYSLGCVGYELLTGKRPFQGNPAELMWRHLCEVPISPKAIRPETRPELDSLILALMAKDPACRPSARDVMQWLKGMRDCL